MERPIERYAFRLRIRQQIVEHEGRLRREEDGRCSLQVWVRTPEQPNILLTVDPVKRAEAVWPLFRALCAHRGYAPVEMRAVDGTPGPWTPIPE